MINIVNSDPRQAVHELVEVSGKRLAQYQRRTKGLLGIQFPFEYVSRGETLVMVDHRGEMCGGAMVVMSPPFRSIDSIPVECHNDEINEFLGCPHTAELNGVWLSAKEKSPFLSFVFWTLILKRLLEVKKQRFLFTFDNSNDRMKSLANWLKPKILFSGRTQLLPGMKSETTETIAVADSEPLVAFLKMLERRNIGQVGQKEGSLENWLGSRSRGPAVEA